MTREKETTHLLKLAERFAGRVRTGQKKFEVRKNDRDFQVGDTVVFKPVDEGLFAYNDMPSFKITYVLSGWGIEEGYVVFGMDII